MKKRIIKLTSLVFIIVLSFAFLSVSVNAGSFSNVVNEVIEDKDIITGVHWYKKNITSTDEEGTSASVLTNVVEVRPGSAEVVSWAILDGTGVKKSNVQAIAEDYEAKHPGKKVIAAVNDDYFGTTNGVASTRNPLVIDGRVINANPDSTAKNRLYAMALNSDLSLNSDNNLPYYLTEQGASLEVSEHYYLDIIRDNVVVDTIELDDFNQNPSSNSTTFTYNYVVNANSNEEMFELTTVAKSNITNTVAYNNVVGDVYYIRGHINTNELTTSTDSDVTIISSNQTVINELKTCSDTIIYKKVAGEFAGYSSIFGSQQPTMINGEVLPKEEIVDYGSHRDIRRARTTIGFKADGTMVFLTTDEKNTSGTSGTSLRESASILKEYGCVTSFNLDGGGSTCCYCLEDGSLKVQNNPSDGAPRAVGNAILVVKEDLTKANIESSIINNNGNVNIDVSFKKFSDKVVNVSASVNGNKIDLVKSNNTYNTSIKLEDGVRTKIYVSVTYKSIEDKDVSIVIQSETFIYHYPKMPSDFIVMLAETKDGKYEASIIYEDNSATVNSIKIKTSDSEVLYSENVLIDSSDFSLIVNYDDSEGNKEVTITDFELAIDNYVPSEVEKTGCNKGFNVFNLIFILPAIALFFAFKKKKELE